MDARRPSKPILSDPLIIPRVKQVGSSQIHFICTCKNKMQHECFFLAFCIVREFIEVMFLFAFSSITTCKTGDYGNKITSFAIICLNQN